MPVGQMYPFVPAPWLPHVRSGDTVPGLPPGFPPLLLQVPKADWQPVSQ